MSARNLIGVGVLSAGAFFGLVAQAMADTTALAQAAAWGPSRVLLGVVGILFAAALAGPQRD
jgi:uncharacterized membrane protein